MHFPKAGYTTPPLQTQSIFLKIIFNYITTIHTHRIPVAQFLILVIWQMIIKRIIRATGFIVSNQTLCKNFLWCHSLSSGLSFLHYMTEQKIWQGKMKKVFVLWLFPPLTLQSYTPVTILFGSLYP